ncbi:MAG: T9SS type A sorting domain-containing protein [Bacteroidetes bacterium]|nr:T9SS type A sorting domain-containing protein [Bacteroidota bacterium]
MDKSVFRAKGVYVVSISSPNNIITTKLIIQ